MPVYALTDELSFPHPSLATADGLLAVGGDLSPERLVTAYASGIFPWYTDDDPEILWWAPSPRLVLLPEALHVGRSLRKAQRRAPYRLSLDEAFPQVIRGCAGIRRPGQAGTWITEEMQAAYTELHRLGVAHSVEAWEGTSLAGGVYGVALGGVFFGESMFARRPDASKLAFVALVEQLRRWGFVLVDCQVVTEHMVRFGAHEVSLEEFLARVDAGLELPHRPGPWRFDPPPSGG
ncbi:MAG: leucyl/phenylalanyl-tRNA--protein transferase [Myxococcales bacterium]|nr:leucyl/phenylalanyl-tRNA--protein transferase [Myxococcales bacterium]